MIISIEELSKMKFGKLKIENPREISSGSSKKIKCICDCGNESLLIFLYMDNGRIYVINY